MHQVFPAWYMEHETWPRTLSIIISSVNIIILVYRAEVGLPSDKEPYLS